MKPSEPPNLEECANYDNYKKRLRLWEDTMVDVPSNRKAMMILESLSNNSKFKKNLVEKFWDKHTAEQVIGGNGLALVKQYLELDERKLYKMIFRWETLEDCKRSRGEDIRDFVDKFKMAYEAVLMVCDMVIPSTIRYFMLFRRAEVDIRRDLILSKLDYEDEETLHEQRETQLKEVLGG